jgi:FixJ family two-component response regulator
MARREQIDAAVLDIHLNGNSTSYPVAEALESRRIPFMFVTGIDKGGMAPLFPGAAVVQKPFAQQQIQEAVKRMMAKARCT